MKTNKRSPAIWKIINQSAIDAVNNGMTEADIPEKYRRHKPFYSYFKTFFFKHKQLPLKL